MLGDLIASADPDPVVAHPRPRRYRHGSEPADLPLYLLCFLSLLIGALIGVAAAWIAGHRNRRELSARRRRIAALERELMATQSQLEDHPAPAKTQLPATRQLQNVRQ
jgi:hypothetical protein